LTVKYRQLAHQIVLFIKDPLANSMATFNLTNAMLNEGTMFTFSSWVCVANGSSGLNNDLVNTKKPEASGGKFRSDLDDFVDNLDDMLLPDLVRELEHELRFNPISTCATPRLIRLDLTQSEDQRAQLPFRLRSTATIYQEAIRSESLSALEEDLDWLLKIGERDATACHREQHRSNSRSSCRRSACGTTQVPSTQRSDAITSRALNAPPIDKNAKRKGKDKEDDDQEDKSEGAKFQDVSKIINVIFGGESGFASKRAQEDHSV
jgi:hypothetical protein